MLNASAGAKYPIKGLRLHDGVLIVPDEQFSEWEFHLHPNGNLYRAPHRSSCYSSDRKRIKSVAISEKPWLLLHIKLLQQQKLLTESAGATLRALFDEQKPQAGIGNGP